MARVRGNGERNSGESSSSLRTILLCCRICDGGGSADIDWTLRRSVSRAYGRRAHWARDASDSNKSGSMAGGGGLNHQTRAFGKAVAARRWSRTAGGFAGAGGQEVAGGVGLLG